MKAIVIAIILATALIVFNGCGTTPPNFVVVTSGTTVGFDVSASPATQTPQATLAYKRVELALVPVTTNGVTPDVLMDFRLNTQLFSANGGIYSRVAVGKNATTQVPAALMMSKDKDGTLPSIPTLQEAYKLIPTGTVTNK